jgi:putative transcriptional regulator
VPLYCGGPVAEDQLILVAWKWDISEGSFKLFFGITDVKAQEILSEDPLFELRAFLGHSGWGEGQLSEEIEDGAWVPVALTPEIETAREEDIWRTILHRQSPELRILADEPEDLSLN